MDLMKAMQKPEVAHRMQILKGLARDAPRLLEFAAIGISIATISLFKKLSRVKPRNTAESADSRCPDSIDADY